MKKQLLLTFSGLLCCASIFGQAMKKGETTIAAGIGIGIYKVSMDTDTDGAVARLIPVSAEYSISDRLSIGIAYQQSNYLTNSDSSSNKSESVKGNLIGAKCDFHFLNSEKTDLYIGVTAGYNNLVFKGTDNNDQSFYLSGGGFGYQVNTGLKIFFGNHIGIFFGFTYSSYSFVWQKYEIDGQSEPFPDNYSNLKLSGGEGKIGLVGKF